MSSVFDLSRSESPFEPGSFVQRSQPTEACDTSGAGLRYCDSDMNTSQLASEIIQQIQERRRTENRKIASLTPVLGFAPISSVVWGIMGHKSPKSYQDRTNPTGILQMSLNK